MQTTTKLPEFLELDGIEGFRAEAYKCSANEWTIGIGSTKWEDGTPVQEDDTIDLQHARIMCSSYIRVFVEPALDRLINVNLESWQRDAFGSFVYNFGETKCQGYNLPKYINAQLDWRTIGRKWMEYVISDGEKSLGLYRRRLAELLMFYNMPWKQALRADWGDAESMFFEAYEPTPEPVIDPPVVSPEPIVTAPKPEPKEAVVVSIPEPEPPKVTSQTYNLGTSETGGFSDFKSMLLARRFWGWLLVIFGRTQIGVDLARMQPQAADFIGYVVGDAVVFSTTAGVITMIAGEGLKWWGERKATKGLK